jgi:hypothetical protein
MLVEEMKHPEIQELPVLEIDKAIKATQDYVHELEEMKSTGLTNKQAERLIRFTQELTSATENEE